MSEGTIQRPDVAIRILIGAALLAVLTVIIQAPWPSPCKDQQSYSAAHQQEGQATHSGAIVASQPSSGATYYQCDEKDSDWWGLRIAAIVGAIGFFQLVMFYRQWAVMREGLGDTKKAADAALANAEAAKAQADALVKSEKPYVFLEIIEPGVEVDGAGRMRVASQRMVFHFVNYGRTPALLHEFKETYAVIEGLENVPNPINPMTDRGRLLPMGVVSAPGRPYEFATRLLTAVDIMPLLDDDAWNERRLQFTGFLRYSDTFGTNYIMGWLAIFQPTAGRWALRGDGRWSYSREENPADIPRHPDEQT